MSIPDAAQPPEDTTSSAPTRSADTVETQQGPSAPPIEAWFLGPKAEQASTWEGMLAYIFQDYIHWRRNYFPEDPVVIGRVARRKHEAWFDGLNSRLDWILGELKAHYPFYSPRYLAHMLSEQTLPSVLGYFAGMLYNPNNVTDEAAPVTVELELEVGRMIAEMIGFNRNRSWAHLCAGGTTANLEALWVARTAQFTPLIVQEFCLQRQIAFDVKMPNGELADIRELLPAELLGLRANEAIFMLRKLAKFLTEDLQKSRRVVIDDIAAAVRRSAFNPSTRGIPVILRQIGLLPTIYVSAAAHYSIKKCANILGYGEDAVEFIPVTDRFRMDVDALRDRVLAQKGDRYIAAVVGIVGTTEEGAVDPIHDIHFFQTQLGMSANRSFWLHVDAAWGGYICSLFRGHAFPSRTQKLSIKALSALYAERIAAYEKFLIGVDGGNQKHAEIWWNNPATYGAFLAMADADSVTIDPHKLGYVPYPAGVVAFRNGLVTELMTQKAQYISDERGGLRSIDEPAPINAVGPYIVEGSKPGAAAAACWLAHKAIPLTAGGHGELMKRSLLKARKLTRYLLHHKHMFKTIERELHNADDNLRHPFTFAPLYEPDTNVLCFVVIPMAWQNEELVKIDTSLKTINAINEQMYGKLTLATKVTSGASPRASRLPYAQPYFVSRTRFEEQQYTYSSIAAALDRVGIRDADYKKEGLFVLRSAVMNPLYATAEPEKDYLLDFVHYLHAVAREIVAGSCAGAAC